MSNLKILPKLVWRDFSRHRSMLGFAMLAIMAACCLIVWFIASIDTAAFSEDNGTSSYYGPFTLAIGSENGLPQSLVQRIEQSPMVERTAFAAQRQAELAILGFQGGMKPSGMGDRRSPRLLAIATEEPPFELKEGHWPQSPQECAVGTAAEQLLGAETGKKTIRRVKVGDVLSVKAGQKICQMTVSGIIPQEIQKDARRNLDSTFNFGFGIGIGGGKMGGAPPPPPKTPATKPQAPEMPDATLSPKDEKLAKELNAVIASNPELFSFLTEDTNKPQKREIPARGGRRPGWRNADQLSPVTPSVYVTMEAMTEIYGPEITRNLLFIRLAEGKKAGEFHREFGQELRRAGISAFDTEKKQPEAGQLSPQRIVGQAWSTIGIVILASVFIIFTTLSMGVSEKTRHLAMLRTIGFTKGQVAMYIMLEGLVLGLLGCLGGLLSGWLLLTVTVFLETGSLPLVTLSPAAIGFAFACSMAGAFLASLLPAWRATGISPTASMVRNLHAPSGKRLFLSGLAGACLLLAIPAIVFIPPLATKTRLLLFSSIGTLFLAIGFPLLLAWAIAFTERTLGKAVAALLHFHPALLSQILTGNYWRTFGTALAISLGLGLFSAIHTWGNSMLNMFWVPTTIPNYLVRFQEGVLGQETAMGAAAMPGIQPGHFMKVSVAQPQLSPELQKAMKTSGAMAMNFVLMGCDGGQAFGEKEPMLRLKFTEGSQRDALREFSVKGARVCIIPETVSFHANLHVGDSIRLEKSHRRKAPQDFRRDEDDDTPAEYAEYRIVGVVDFAWVWLSKCAGVRVSEGRTAGLLFTPFDPLLEDFGSLDNEFFWFDADKEVTHQSVTDYMRSVASDAAARHPLAARTNSFAGGTRWDSGINKNYVIVNSNESLNNSLASRSFSVLDAMAKMPLFILVLSTLAILNTMVVSVRARRWEMGILRACGLTRGAIIRLVLGESLLIGICACIFSLSFGLYYSWLALSLVDYAPMFGVIAPPMTIPLCKMLPGYAIAIAACTIAAIYPAASISRKEISNLLQNKQF